jgi:hypothetical protein
MRSVGLTLLMLRIVVSSFRPETKVIESELVN